MITANRQNDEDALRYLVYTQIAPTPLVRARFCEDCLKAAAQSGDIQYVILGAGMDSFAFREAEFMKAHSVFELDHPPTQQEKYFSGRGREPTAFEHIHYLQAIFEP